MNNNNQYIYIYIYIYKYRKYIIQYICVSNVFFNKLIKYYNSNTINLYEFFYYTCTLNQMLLCICFKSFLLFINRPQKTNLTLAPNVKRKSYSIFMLLIRKCYLYYQRLTRG